MTYDIGMIKEHNQYSAFIRTSQTIFFKLENPVFLASSISSSNAGKMCGYSLYTLVC